MAGGLVLRLEALVRHLTGHNTTRMLRDETSNSLHHCFCSFGTLGHGKYCVSRFLSFKNNDKKRKQSEKTT